MKMGTVITDVVFGILLSLLWTMLGAAELRPENFRKYATLQGDVPSGTLRRLPLTSEVMMASQRNLGDLRVFDAAGRETPFTILKDQIPPLPETRYPCTISQFKTDSSGDVLFFHLPPDAQPVYRIELSIPNIDFQTPVELLGSTDGVEWKTLVQDMFYDFNPFVSLRKTWLEFPVASCTQLQLRMFHDHTSETAGKNINLRYGDLDFRVQARQQKRLKIEGAAALTPSIRKAARVAEEIVLTTPKPSREGRSSVYFLDLPCPAEELQLDIKDAFYFRDASVFSQVTGKQPHWILIGQGSVFSFPTLHRKAETNTTLGLTAVPDKRIKLVLEDRDNPPLEITNVHLRWSRYQLLFFPTGQAPYRLMVGNPKVETAEYDITKFVTQSNWFELDAAEMTIGPLRDQSQYQPLPDPGQGHHWEKPALMVIVILLVTGMSFWTYRLLKTKVPPASSGPIA